MIIRLAFGMFSAILLSLIATPVAGSIARLVGAIDMPNERKIHLSPIPRLGGLAIVLSVCLTLGLLAYTTGFDVTMGQILTLNGSLICIALLIVFAVGIADDIHPIGPGPKFAAELVAAGLCCAAGLRITVVTNPFGPQLFQLGYLSIPITIVWIVGISNAFNLIDGLDGLAGGVGAIASLTMFSVLMLSGATSTALIAWVMAGALIGFLRFNFNPAKIFLGDSGSLMVGMGLALLSVSSSAKGTTIFALLVPVIALGLPIMDTLLTMARRLLRSFLPEGPSVNVLRKLHGMFLPDRSHIHHRLVSLGMSHRRAVLLLYSVSCAFGLGAFVITAFNSAAASEVLLATGIAMLIGIHQLRYREMAVLRNGMFLPLYEWAPMRRSMVQGFLDLSFTGVAFTLAYYLTLRGGMTPDAEMKLFSLLPVVCCVQMGIFLVNGLYQESPGRGGIDEVLRIVRTTAIAVLITSVIAALWLSALQPIDPVRFMLDFYFLITLVGGSHLSFLILKYLFRRETKSGTSTLIYGAGERGLLALHQILNDDRLGLKPVGFLDEHPDLEGKLVNGYKVFGGHWKLQSLVNKYHIEQIVVATDELRDEVLLRLKRFVRDNRISIRTPKLLFEDISNTMAPHLPGARPVADTIQHHSVTDATQPEEDETQQVPVFVSRNERKL
jgi:UDP-GlcNAc:undecaprenyl-phosphate GlcNAc-1-phosphate transferase